MDILSTYDELMKSRAPFQILLSTLRYIQMPDTQNFQSISFFFMGVGTGPTGPAAAGPIIIWPKYDVIIIFL